jgi:predicted MFS family arabinose efflux permease
LAQTIVPLLSYSLIAHFGWRMAYAILACGWGGASLILVLLFFHDPAARLRKVNEAAGIKASTEPLPGLSVHKALRCLPLYRIAIALALFCAVSLAVITHSVSIFKELGIPRGVAAQIAASIGIAGVAGKLLAGWCYDRSGSSWIGFSAFAIASLGFVVLLFRPHNPWLIVLAMTFFGLASGGTLQVAMYLTARYCGMRNFGKVFGMKTSFLAIGMGCGPVLGGVISDTFHSYYPLFIIGVPAGLICGLLVSGLGPYPDWDARAKAENAAAAPACENEVPSPA